MRFLLSFFIFLVTSSSYAEDYYWTITPPGIDFKFNSALEACEANTAAYVVNGVTLVRKTYTPHSDPNGFVCSVRLRRPDGSEFSGGNTAQRRGNSCPTGKTYNPATGSCDIDCSATAGKPTVSLSYAGPRANFPVGSSVPPANPRICEQSCAYTFSGGPSENFKCGSLKDGDPDALWCIFDFIGTGQSCKESDDPSNAGAPPNPDPPKDPNDPTDPRNNCGPGRAWSGTTCVPYFDPDPGQDPGEGGGGGGNGGGGSGGGDGPGDGDGDGDGSGGGNGGDGGQGGSGGGGAGGDFEPGEPGEFPENEEVKEFGESVQSFKTRIENSQLIQAVSNIRMPSGGSCSMPSFSVYLIGNVSFAFVCQLADQVLGPLYYILLAAWAFAAVRTFLEA